MEPFSPYPQTPQIGATGKSLDIQANRGGMRFPLPIPVITIGGTEATEKTIIKSEKNGYVQVDCIALYREVLATKAIVYVCKENEELDDCHIITDNAFNNDTEHNAKYDGGIIMEAGMKIVIKTTGKVRVGGCTTIYV